MSLIKIPTDCDLERNTPALLLSDLPEDIDYMSGAAQDKCSCAQMESDVMVAFLFERGRTAHASHLQHMDIQDGASCHTLYSSVHFRPVHFCMHTDSYQIK